MSVYAGPEIQSANLVFYIDAANQRSYLGSNTANSLITITDRGWSTAGNIPQYDTGNSGSWVFPGNAYIFFANSPATYITTGDYSVETVFLAQSIGTGTRILQKGNTPTLGYYLNINNAGQLSMVISANGSSQNQASVVTNTTLVTNTWYHTVTTVSGTTVSTYINGKLDVTGSTTYAANSYSTPDQLTIACSQGANFGNRHIGNIPLVKFYTKVLSSEEVLRNFNALRGRYNI